MTPAEKLAALGLTLPTLVAPRANYVPYVITGNLLFLSGKGWPDLSATQQGPIPKVGAGVSVDEAYAAARTVGLHLIATMQDALGDLSRVNRVVKLLGMVNAAPDFLDHPKVINGCSDLMIEVFGERGRHARSAVGMGSLPRGYAVEIEAIVEFS
jgi:enamine deaminase RidA (YjgF/YER057c/UK114 family)